MTTDQSRVKKIKCFVVDSETEKALRSIPFEQHNVEADIEIGEVVDAISYLKENRSPDILLIDITKSKFPTSGLDLLADVCEPGVEVIAIGERNEVGVFRDLMNAGIRDYFVKPLPVQPITKCIDSIVGKGQSQEPVGLFHKSGKVVAVVGAVGGIGVSTMVANLGWGLSEKKLKRIALIDMDFQLGTISDNLNIETGGNINQLFDSPDRIDDILVERFMTHISDNFMVLSSQVPLDAAPDYKTESLEAIIDVLVNKFHYVIIDVPRNFGSKITTDLLKKADLVIVLTDYSITGLKSTNKIVEALRSFVSIGQQITIAVNKVGAYTHGEITKAQFEERLLQPIDIEINYDKKESMQALTDGVPVLSTGSGDLAIGLTKMMNLMLGVSSGKNDKTSGGFMSKLFSK